MTRMQANDRPSTKDEGHEVEHDDRPSCMVPPTCVPMIGTADVEAPLTSDEVTLIMEALYRMATDRRTVGWTAGQVETVRQKVLMAGIRAMRDGR